MVLVYVILMIMLVAIARERGLKNGFEAALFSVSLFILLKGIFQYM